MRVPMGEVVDIRKDFTVGNLSIGQKISVIWESMIADSKILGKQRKQEEEKEIKKRNDIFDSLKNSILTSLMFHLVENKTLSEFNQEAMESRRRLCWVRRAWTHSTSGHRMNMRGCRTKN
ncbi:hypothetical protein FACS1894188_10460 [Clostridia bacterium]|nr:hypothetical protein FACS1894188_10460 [Clostridia bacterium]